MKESVFSSILKYFSSLFKGLRSLLGSSLTALPYFFSRGDHAKEVTEQYPDPVSSRTEDDLPARTRGLLYNDINRCTGCGDCQKVCPSSCIEIETETGPETNKNWVSVFDIDFGRCIFCGICVSVCQPGSLVHTKQFEGSVYQLGDMVTPFGRGRVSDEQRQHWEKMKHAEDVF